MNKKIFNIVISISVITAYILLFYFLSNLTEGRVAATAIMPVIIFAILYGLWGGIITGILIFPVNLVLYQIIGGNGLYDIFINYEPGGIIGHCALIITGTTVGYLRDIRKSLKQTITKRELAEDSLKQSDKRYREFIEGTDNLVTQVDHAGYFTFVNQTAKRIFGLNPEECIGLSAFDFIYPDDREQTKEDFTKWIHGNLSSVTYENRQVSRTGEVRVMLWTIKPHYDVVGNLTSLDAIARDITEIRQVEEGREKLVTELKEALAKVKTLSGFLPICSSCKKIRDDKGYWNQIEAYIRDHSEAEFSHSICPECSKKLYPELSCVKGD